MDGTEETASIDSTTASGQKKEEREEGHLKSRGDRRVEQKQIADDVDKQRTQDVLEESERVLRRGGRTADYLDELQGR